MMKFPFEANCPGIERTDLVVRVTEARAHLQEVPWKSEAQQHQVVPHLVRGVGLWGAWHEGSSLQATS